jgi:soluble cytochrome b562
MNYLPEDIFSLILKKRTEEMKKDKEIKDNKKNYDKVVEYIDNTFFFVLSGKYYYNEKNISGIDGENVSNLVPLDYITPYKIYT